MASETVPATPAPPCDLVQEIVQAIIAIMVVGGGGFAILQGNVHVTEVTAFMGLVLGFYFGRNLTLRQVTAVKIPASDGK